MKGSVAALLAIGLTLVAMPASAQRRDAPPRPPATAPRPGAPRSVPPVKPPTASEAYWGAVRAASGPIGFPQATAGDQFTRNSRNRWRGTIFPSVPYVETPEPVYVPVYVPGPVVYVPVPAAAPSVAPADNGASIASAPRRPEKFYVIPGCYAGNKPPQANNLPAGCDIKTLRVNTW